MVKIKFEKHIAAASMLFFGTISSATAKIQMIFPSAGYNGEIHYFEKPSFQVLIVFFSMSLGILICPFWGPTGPINLKSYTFRQYLLPIFTSVLGTFANFIMTAGLTRIGASIQMMLRGGLTIFSSIFSIIFLKRHIHRIQWIGIAMMVFALVIVGISGIMNDSDTNHSWSDRLKGMAMVICGLVFQGGQLVYDEYLIKELNIPIMIVLGMEGVWGVLISLLIVCPFCLIVPGKDPSLFGGSLENIGDSFQMLAHSTNLALIILASIFAIFGYDTSGMTVTGTLSSVHRTIYEALRPLTTWVFMLFITLCGSPYGETWSKWSWLQLGGFVILVFSSLVFNNVFHWELSDSGENNQQNSQ